ncbi:MAG: hypothetical protein MJK04_02175 [Psychrosphaera sp.]|nr:hypothetical protein [Psychrosphaera sp.]
MELAVYIQKQTDEVAAKFFGVKKRTVSSWRRLERAPAPSQSLNIIEKTDCKIDWKGIYHPYAKYQQRIARRQVLHPNE